MKLVQFSQHWNQQATSYPSPKCLVDQKLIQAAATDQMPDPT